MITCNFKNLHSLLYSLYIIIFFYFEYLIDLNFFTIARSFKKKVTALFKCRCVSFRKWKFMLKILTVRAGCFVFLLLFFCRHFKVDAVSLDEKKIVENNILAEVLRRAQKKKRNKKKNLF